MNRFLRLLIATMAAMQSLADLASAEEPVEELPSFYAPNEEQGSFDLVTKPYPIPIKTTTYVDFVFNLPDNLPDLFHVVMGEVINTQPRHLHHFVLTGCTDKIDPAMEGMSTDLSFDSMLRCTIPLGGWAPGGDIFGNSDLDTGVLMGKGLGVQAIQLNVHYTDGVYEDAETLTHKIATDGIRVHYITGFRPYTTILQPLIDIGTAPRQLTIPPQESRFYVTQTCKVNTSCKDAAPEQVENLASLLELGGTMLSAGGLSCPAVKLFCNMDGRIGSFIQMLCPVSCGYCDESEDPKSYRLTGINYHAHLLGREMYTTLIRDQTFDSNISIERSAASDPSQMMIKDLKSSEFWIYDFQETIPFDFDDFEQEDGTILRGTEIKPGDKIQATCVYDSTYRDESTKFGLSTYDEMCITTTLVTFPTPASLLAFGTDSSDSSNISLQIELAMMSFTCDNDEETDVYSGILTEGEDARDIWKAHPISEAEGCTYPTNGFFPGLFQTRNCPVTDYGSDNTICSGFANRPKMLVNQVAGASCTGGTHNGRDLNDGLTEKECLEGGGEWAPYTCASAESWLQSEASTLDNEMVEYVVEYWWEPKCCSDADIIDSGADADTLLVPSIDSESDVESDALLVDIAVSAASGFAKGSTTLALLSAVAALML